MPDGMRFFCGIDCGDVEEGSSIFGGGLCLSETVVPGLC